MYCKLDISSHDPLVDDTLDIRVSGLLPGQHVTMLSRLDDEGKNFHALAHYDADTSGRIDLKESPSLGGLYKGVEPMGLFWSMEQDPGQKPGLRIVRRIATTPIRTTLSVCAGHIEHLADLAHQIPLATTTINRWYMASHVQRLEINEGDIVGTLFIPKVGGPYPGILDLFGGIGGGMEHRSALLASRGFASFNLQYIPPAGTKNYSEIKSDLTYLGEAVEWLLRQPRVIPHAAGVIGTSKGAEVAMLTALANPKVKGVVFINGSHYVAMNDIKYKGRILKSLQVPVMPDDDGVSIKEQMAKIPKHIKDECAFPVEDTTGRILLVHSGADKCMGKDCSDYILERMAKHGQSSRCERVIYPGAGHLIEPPHAPHCKASYSPIPGTMLLWGGDPLSQARAQEDCWPRMRTFLRDSICEEDSHRSALSKL